MDSAKAKQDEALVERWYTDDERTTLLRYLQLSDGSDFQVAAVEVPDLAVRHALLAWLRSHIPGRLFIEISLKSLAGRVLSDEIPPLLPTPIEGRFRPVVVLTDLESTRGAVDDPRPAVFMRLNLERDALTRALPMTCLVAAYPSALLKLRTIAPDFCHYFSTLVRQSPPEQSSESSSPPIRSTSDWQSPSMLLELSEVDWPALLREADRARSLGAHARARDHIAEFLATPERVDWHFEATLLDAAVADATEGAPASIAILERDNWEICPRHATRVRALLVKRDCLVSLGQKDASDAILKEAARVAGQSGQTALHAAVRVARSEAYWRAGNTQKALTGLERAFRELRFIGRERDAWNARHAAAYCLGVLGRFDEQNAIADELKRTADSMGDPRLRAIALGMNADVLQVRGELDEALRIRREEQLPVYENLLDIRSRAATLGHIASILQVRGDFVEALRIRREEELPVYERLGERLERAFTLGHIADLLQLLGDFNEAIRIRQQEELPVYKQLGEIRSQAVTYSKIADVYQVRGDFNEALRLLRENVLPVYQQMGLRREIAIANAKVGQVLMHLGNHREAVRILEESIIALETLRSPLDLIDLRIGFATVLWNIGNHKGALRECQVALSRAEALREPSVLLRTARAMRGLLLAQRKPREALAMLDRVGTILAEDGRWSALNELDKLRPPPSAPSPPSLPGARRRR